ncbi:hypothetical protein ALO77_200164 [Pseudomonas coronafaciens pv. garcae]|nr:hypothetical protein ALO77_200164 [Pseudomonas coronafaciens pv. garcae]
MIVIDKNLEHLAIQYSICDKSLFDEFSLKIQLSRHYYDPRRDPAQEIVYMAHPAPASLFSERKEIALNLVLLPGEQVITCSPGSNTRFCAISLRSENKLAGAGCAM